MGYRLFLAVLWLTLAYGQVPLVAAFPSPVGFVNDFAGVLSEASRSDMDAELREFRQETSAEVVLVTVKSLDGLSVEDYAVRLFELWGIGKKATDNGVLILVVPSERVMRIEVGYGLEPVLPDGLAGEIIRNEFLPAFKDGDYARGIRQGLARVVEVVRKGEVASTESADAPPLWFVIPFLSVFVAFGSFAVGIGVKSKTYAPILFGGLFAGIPLLLALAFGPAAIVLPLLGVPMLMWGYAKGASPFWLHTLRGPTVETTNSGWTMGASSSSRSSDDEGSTHDDGSSDSSFGGGSSGGGGASGRW